METALFAIMGLVLFGATVMGALIVLSLFTDWWRDL